MPILNHLKRGFRKYSEKGESSLVLGYAKRTGHEPIEVSEESA
jgi:hypothetical protein